MKKVNRVLLLLLVALFSGALATNAQIVVNIRPERPHYQRVVAPTPRHVWVEEEWEPRGGGYVWAGGHWVLPPRPHAVWIPGHWKRHPRGWVWIRGHWR